MHENLPEQLPKGTVPEIQQRIAKLRASSVESYIQQTPHAANGNVALAQTTIVNNGVTISMPGFATPETANTDKAHLLIAAALNTAMHNALCGIEGHTDVAQPRRQESHSPAERRHSTSKGLSPKQLQFIARLGTENERNPEDVARKLVGKPLAQCSSADADKIIKSLKGTPAENDSVPW